MGVLPDLWGNKRRLSGVVKLDDHGREYGRKARLGQDAEHSARPLLLLQASAGALSRGA